MTSRNEEKSGRRRRQVPGSRNGKPAPGCCYPGRKSSACMLAGMSPCTHGDAVARAGTHQLLCRTFPCTPPNDGEMTTPPSACAVDERSVGLCADLVGTAARPRQVSRGAKQARSTASPRRRSISPQWRRHPPVCIWRCSPRTCRHHVTRPSRHPADSASHRLVCAGAAVRTAPARLSVSSGPAPPRPGPALLIGSCQAPCNIKAAAHEAKPFIPLSQTLGKASCRHRRTAWSR